MFRFSGRRAASRPASITAIVDSTGMLTPLASLLAHGYARDGHMRLLAPAPGGGHALQNRLEILAPRFDSIIIDASGASTPLVRTALIAAHRAVITVAAEAGAAAVPLRLLEDMRLFNPRLQIWLVAAALQPVASAPLVPAMPLPLPGVRMARTVLRTWRLEDDAAHLYREMCPASQRDERV